MFVGSVGLAGLGEGELAREILFNLRLPRVLLAAVAGAALGVAGAAFQAVFQNALADPFIIGSSSGAALGAGIVMLFPLVPFHESTLPLSLAAFAGSLAATGAVLVISRAAGFSSVMSLLLAGTSVSSFCSSLLSLLVILTDGGVQRVYYWTMGSLAVSWDALLPVLPLIGAGMLIIFLYSRALDLLVQGDETAESLGLNSKKARIAVITGAALASGAAVSVCGVIGFAGLIAPHIARLLTGPAHRRLLPASALIGALLLLCADMISRAAAPPLEIPIGVITALGGSPFFLYLLVKYGRGAGKG